MNYKVKSTDVFERQAKFLIKKYPSLKHELLDLISLRKEHPITGTSLGQNCYKIRPAVKSKGKGKSGGMGIITNFLIFSDTVYLLSIYDKSEKAGLTDRELKDLLSQLPD